MRRTYRLVILLLVWGCSTYAQDGVTTFGFGYKPIFPSSYFRTGPQDFSDQGINFTIAQRSGFTAGGLIRHGISKRLSFESGIIYSKRKFDLSVYDTTFTGKSEFKIIGYEIPANLMVFVQLGQQLWMNATLGVSLDLFPSDVYTEADYFRHYSARRHTANSAMNAGLGLEYRTKKSGYFYFGASYHRLFNSMYTSLVEYYPTRKPSTDLPTAIGRTELQGDYFTFDIRYYFYEAPEKKKAKKAKN